MAGDVVFFTGKEDPTMARRRGHTEEQILAAWRHAEGGTAVAEVCRDVGISEQTFYVWTRKYAGLGLNELRELRQLREENTKLKRWWPISRSIGTWCRRWSEKSCTASGPAGPGPLGANDLSSQ
jgi:putative transposase